LGRPGRPNAGCVSTRALARSAYPTPRFYVADTQINDCRHQIKKSMLVLRLGNDNPFIS
jgi:hypothetical protein